MGVSKYKINDRSYWQIDEWLTSPDGKIKRYRKRKIPTKEQAMALAAKVRSDAFEGRFFDRPKKSSITVSEAWESYAPTSKRDNDTWLTERGRAQHVIRHLGTRRCVELTEADIDDYRQRRSRELTVRKKPPTPGTLDREVELLKRMLNYAVRCKRLEGNPIAHAKLLRKSNVRDRVLSSDDFEKIYQAADELLRPIILLAFETGMRKEEVLNLRRSRLNLREGVIRLTPEETKTEVGRAIYLPARVLEDLRRLPTRLGSEFVFVNPDTGTRWMDISTMWERALQEAGIKSTWFHDLRRSFVTNARRVHGIPESVVMKMSGHKTRAVFDRYNIVSEDDVRQAVERINSGAGQTKTRSGSEPEQLGQEMDKVELESPERAKASSAKYR